MINIKYYISDTSIQFELHIWHNMYIYTNLQLRSIFLKKSNCIFKKRLLPHPKDHKYCLCIFGI